MTIATFYAHSGQALRYELDDTELARQWAVQVRAFQAVMPAISQVPKWNAHLGYPADYERVPAYWGDLQRLAALLGLQAPARPEAAWLNEAHRLFVERWRLSPQRRLWLELNNAIHWHEHHLQGRGPADVLDLNRSHYQARAFPADARAALEPVRDGGLYLGYAQIGRWWDEVWRAGDLGLPVAQHMQQTIWNASCILAHHSLPCDAAAERRFWEQRADWGCRWEDRQCGLYRIGRRLDALPPGWGQGQITGISLSGS